MSREPFRPTARSTEHSERPAEALEQQWLGRTEPARDWQQPPQQLPAEPDLPPMPRTAPQVSLSDLAHAYGTVGLAERLGVSRRQAERYAAGKADPTRARKATRQRVHDASEHLAQQQLTQQRREARRARKAVRDAQRGERHTRGQNEWGSVVERLGGVQATAAELGRHPRTVERWLNGERHPNEADRERLARADRHVRVRTAFGLREPQRAGGGDGGAAGSSAPAAPTPEPTPGPSNVYVRASGFVHVEGYYRYSRQVGVQGELAPGGRHPLPPDVAATMVDCMGRGDRDAALQAFEEHLSVGYAQCDGYDPNGDTGWHFHQLDEFELVQLPEDTLDGGGGLM